LFSKAMAAIHSKQNTIVIVDTSCSKLFKRLSYFTQATFESPYSVIFILGTQTSSTFDIHIEQNLEAQKLQNVVGIIPGKTKPDEYVIFSGHYDHLGVDPSKGTDSIYNGANDDASGTTAVIELAKYYKKLNNNERTLIFAAFTAEEIGGYGSQYFSQQFDPNKVIAMFNIEMIGTDSKWGNNSAYITGFEKSNMGEILQKNLQGSKFKFYPDPYTEQNLFYRSDNATLARQGVPAHTISTSKMDSEPNYHKLSDEISTLDLTNMAEIIKSVAVSAQTIISGKDTPTRVDASSLK
jgi:Zn-dependent M28 family amino/carboxypeptidase